MGQGIAFYSFAAAPFNGVHNLGTNDLKVCLSNTAPDVANDQYFTDITEIAAGNGYVAGGQSLDNVVSSQSLGVYTLTADDETFTASGGTMASFRYAIIYNDSATNKDLICYYDKGVSITLNDTGQSVVDFTGAIVTYNVT